MLMVAEELQAIGGMRFEQHGQHAPPEAGFSLMPSATAAICEVRLLGSENQNGRVHITVNLHRCPAPVICADQGRAMTTKGRLFRDRIRRLISDVQRPIDGCKN
jgi:hypothetical protein